jgi:hypothetical protein
MHDDALTLGWYVPGVHARQFVAAVVFENAPAGQAGQSVSTVGWHGVVM